MSRPILLFLFLSFFLLFTTARQIIPARNLAQSGAASPSCPLNFTTLRTLLKEHNAKPANNVVSNCQYISEGLRFVLSEYLRLTGSFYPPVNSSDACWNSYESVVDSYLPGFKILPSCGFNSSWISHGCMNITTRSDFERIVPQSAINAAIPTCNQSLENNSPCASCLTSISSIQASYLNGASIGNISDCTNLPLIYAGAFMNYLGPSDPGTSQCLFSLDFFPAGTSNFRRKLLIALILVVGIVGLGSAFGGYFVVWLRRRNELRKKRRRKIGRIGSGSGSELPSIGGSSTHLKEFTFDEIKQATKKFHRDNLIGRGGYGNVYKARLSDGSEVAVKRFKNCSVAGHEGFKHEVEVIASIRHVNLMELRGYCVATTSLEGNQRIIVCDLIKNGSLHDHLFGGGSEGRSNLSWPIRQKIALGTARGLAYLHYGAQPAIIHRDIKASNILLDEGFDAKVADFGLAKAYPEGSSHVSTRVAGTMGYVAPEYALYGQLTERSDVYSFGVVLLELLSGKKAIISVNEGQPTSVTDWAWSLVRKGHVLDVIEKGMPDVGPDSVMEKYVLIAVLCSHPQLYARPTMDQVVKILESDMPVPVIPERPIPLVSELEDIERSASSSESGRLFTSGGFQTYTMTNFDSSSTTEYEETESLSTSIKS